MTDSVRTREMNDDDLEGVLEVMRRALGETSLLKRNTAAFAWKHFDNPFGRSILIVSEAGSRIVGLRALMRWEMLGREGHVVRCVRAVDTATDPDFQRRGLFRRMTEEAVEVARAEDVDMVFNTPNSKSGPGYVSMGWQEVGPIGVLVRPTRKTLNRGEVSYEDPIDSFVSGTTEPTVPTIEDREPRGLRTPRSAAYWEWRFAAHPTARYRQLGAANGIAVVRPNVRGGRRELVLSEVLGEAAPAIRMATRASRSQYMAAWFSKGSPERRAALGAGLLPVPSLHPLTLMARPLNAFQNDVSSPNAWDLSVSDLELL